jgi:hypothetical protein
VQASLTSEEIRQLERQVSLQISSLFLQLTSKQVMIAFLFIFYLFYNLGFNALLYSYPVEVLPYPIRAKGFSLLMAAGKSATSINVLVNPIGLQAIGWKYYNVYVGWLWYVMLPTPLTKFGITDCLT